LYLEGVSSVESLLGFVMLHQMLDESNADFLVFAQSRPVVLLLDLHGLDVQGVTDRNLLLFNGYGFLEGNLEVKITSTIKQLMLKNSAVHWSLNLVLIFAEPSLLNLHTNPVSSLCVRR
jgi:hypothetical protein